MFKKKVKERNPFFCLQMQEQEGIEIRQWKNFGLIRDNDFDADGSANSNDDENDGDDVDATPWRKKTF